MQRSDQDIHFIPFIQLIGARYVSLDLKIYNFHLLIDQMCFYSVDNNNFILKEYVLLPDRKLNDKITNELALLRPAKYYLNVVGQFVSQETNTSSYTGVDYYQLIDILPIFFNQSFYTHLQILTDHKITDLKILAIFSPCYLINQEFELVDPKGIINKNNEFESDLEPLNLENQSFKNLYNEDFEDESSEFDWQRENFEAMTDGQFGDYDDLDGDFDLDSHTGR